MRWIESYRPQSVLDVGMGYGKYGFLIKERLDNFGNQIEIVGIEIFPDYIWRSKPVWYDEYYIGGFLDEGRGIGAEDDRLDEILGHYGPFDLILMIDVLEHFSEADGYKALTKALSLGKKVLISTPLAYPQGPMYGNDHEAHLSEWPQRKLEEFIDTYEQGDFEVLRAGTPDTVLVVMGLS